MSPGRDGGLYARLGTLLPIERTLDGELGVEFEAATDNRVRARIPATEHLRGIDGFVHGGVFAALAESLASIGSALAATAQGTVAMGLSNSTTTLARTRADGLRGEAWLVGEPVPEMCWQVEVHDDTGLLCTASTILVALRPRRSA